MVRCFRLVVAFAWLVEQLVLVIVIVRSHFFLHLLLDVAREPVFRAVTLVSLVYYVFMFVANVLDYEVLALENFVADLAFVAFSLGNLFAFVMEIILHICLDEFLFGINQLTRTTLDSLLSYFSVPLHKSDASSPFKR